MDYRAKVVISSRPQHLRCGVRVQDLGIRVRAQRYCLGLKIISCSGLGFMIISYCCWELRGFNVTPLQGSP